MASMDDPLSVVSVDALTGVVLGVRRTFTDCVEFAFGVGDLPPKWEDPPT